MISEAGHIYMLSSRGDCWSSFAGALSVVVALDVFATALGETFTV